MQNKTKRNKIKQALTGRVGLNKQWGGGKEGGHDVSMHRLLHKVSFEILGMSLKKKKVKQTERELFWSPPSTWLVTSPCSPHGLARNWVSEMGSSDLQADAAQEEGALPPCTAPWGLPAPTAHSHKKDLASAAHRTVGGGEPRPISGTFS